MHTVYAGIGLIGCAGLLFAIRQALKSIDCAPTTRMVLLFACGCCLASSLGAWIVEAFAWFRVLGTSAVPRQVAGLIIAVPAIVVAVTGIFFVHHLKKKKTPKPRDEWSAFILPLAFVVGVGGAIGAVGDSIAKGTSDTAVNLATFAVVSTHSSKIHRP